jgi:hypothetical protein
MPENPRQFLEHFYWPILLIFLALFALAVQLAFDLRSPLLEYYDGATLYIWQYVQTYLQAGYRVSQMLPISILYADGTYSLYYRELPFPVIVIAFMQQVWPGPLGIRVVGLLTTLGSLLFMSLTVRAAYGARNSLFATLLFALTPVAGWLTSLHPMWETFGLCYSLICFWLFLRYHEHPSPARLFVLLLSCFVGSFIQWVVYFVTPILVFWMLLERRWTLRSWQTYALPAVNIVAFSLYMIHVMQVVQSPLVRETQSSLWEALMHYSGGEWGLVLREYVEAGKAMLLNSFRFHGIPLVLLAVLGFGVRLVEVMRDHRPRRERLTLADKLTLAFLAFGLAYYVVFRVIMLYNDWLVLFLTPFLALSAVQFVLWLGERLPNVRWQTLVAILSILAVAAGSYHFVSIFTSDDYPTESFRAIVTAQMAYGEEVAGVIEPGEEFAASFNIGRGDYYLYGYFHAGCVRTLDDFQELMSGPYHLSYFIMATAPTYELTCDTTGQLLRGEASEPPTVDDDLLEYLQDNYESFTSGPLTVFVLEPGA